ncbi:cytochrome P460 family protein [uncultured Nitrospira sp.]|uniref:cytochrome P460 family protein n=1 Tax=uncultured Nitrospira sp. TaxID=157176 RepID=UPI003140955C
MQRMSIAFLALMVLVCFSPTMPIAAKSNSMPKDGELAFPSEYKSFPIFLSGVQKPDAIRDLSVNPIGAKNQPGHAFANGSILVMEIYSAQKNAEGALEKGADGNLVKADLAKVFVMQKGAGWGEGAPENLKNGDWIYSAFKANGERLEVDYTTCRACHLPLGESKDFVHRYDEYFEKRMHAVH